jgi:hypothetical protein
LRAQYFLLVLISLTACSSPQNNSPLLLQATHEGSALSQSSFAFRKDGSFEWMNGLGDPVEGKYTMKDSFITLDKTGFDSKVVKSKYLKIVHQLPWSDFSEDFVVQIDDKGAIIDSNFVFRVVVDKRNQ